MNETLQKFIEGYTSKDLSKIDEFMNIFSSKKDIQMIGIGATKPGAYEWFSGIDEIKEIVISDWTNWGTVVFEKDTLRTSGHTDVLWFSICAQLAQKELSEETWDFFRTQMNDILNKEEMNAHDKMFEAAYYGMNRVREKNLGVGYMYDMVITGVMIFEDTWKIHTLHWSMPVE